ncbi:MAG: hypothetical protein ACREHD_15160 [Pirellulales bacterium]
MIRPFIVFPEALRRLAVKAAMAVLLLITALNTTVRGDDVPAISDVAAAILRSRAPVESLSLTIERTDHNKDGQISLTATENYKFKGAMRYLDLVQSRKGVIRVETAAGPEVQTKTTDEKWLTTRQTRAYDGQEMRMIVSDQMAEIHSPATRDVAPGSRFDSYYLRSIGWYVSDPMATADFERLREEGCLPRAFQVAGFIVSRVAIPSGAGLVMEGDFELRAEGQDVFLGHEKIWLDPAHGMMLVRREAVDRRNGREIERVEADDPIEIIGGCWLPRICRVYLPGDSPSSSTVSELRIAAWSVNDQRAEDFGTAFPPLARVTDLVASVEKGIPLKDPLVKYTDANGRLLESPPRQVFAQRRAQYAPWIVGAMVLCCAFALWWRQRPSRRTIP